MSTFLFVNPITFEDCDVLGGRITVQSAATFTCYEGKDSSDIMIELMNTMVLKSHNNMFMYPYSRLAIVCIHLGGRISVIFTSNEKKDAYGFVSDLAKYLRMKQDYKLIGMFLREQNIQLYDIFQEKQKGVFEAIGYKTPKDKEKYGHAYDVFRCLDLLGTCNADVIEKRLDFHNYMKYDLGEEYYIEGYDSPISGCREYWLGREYMSEKFLVASSDLEDAEYADGFGIIIDQDMAEKICRLTEIHEYLLIDNDYHLRMIPLKMDGDDEIGLWDD